MVENKTKPNEDSVIEFIESLDNLRRQSDAKRALQIYNEVTGFSPVLWGSSIIGFGIYHYIYDSGRQGTMPAASVSPRKANITFYLGEKFKKAKALYGKLGKHKKTKVCLYINKLDDVDLDVLKEIISLDFALENSGGC